VKKIDKAKVRRILVITLSNIGDIILTTPVVQSLVEEFKDAKIDIMVSPNGRELFSSNENIKDVIIYDKKSSPFSKFKLFLNLRGKKYDLVVDLRNTILPLILGAKFITNPFRHDQKTRLHKKRIHLGRLEEIGIDTAKNYFYIPIKGDDKEYIDKVLFEFRGKPFIVVSPGAKSHVKRWPLKNFANLCDMLKRSLGYEIVLIGDANDRIVIERVLFYMKTKPLNLIEKTNIGQLAYLVKKAALLITNDSAPLHVGSAVDAKILAFFGPTDEKKYGPLTKSQSRVLRNNMKCSPCEVPQCINRDNKYECLKTISVDQAFKVARELLGHENTINANR